jgi:hypothetical protein
MSIADDMADAKRRKMEMGGSIQEHLDAIRSGGAGRHNNGRYYRTTGTSGAQYIDGGEFFYCDKDDNHYGLVRKFVNKDDPKDKYFNQFHWDGKDFKLGAPKPKIPYYLRELIGASPETPVFICEGEKDADNVVELGLIATCSQGPWTPELNVWFEGKRTAYVLEDNDDHGRTHARKVARNLRSVVGEVRIVSLPGLPEKGDVTDWLEAGGTKEELLELCAAAPVFEGASKRVARMLPWREARANGSPIPSMYNARLAITALGIECSYDTFHNKMLVGFFGDVVRHELQSIVGEVSDTAIIQLRQFMSERFYFDLTEKHTRDAVISLALEHCFDPVRDMLDRAEADWDGVARLDGMAVNYFNCEDTPLNKAFVRKMMIAAVHRVRVPGCKFDSIVVLESKEGWNKSSAFFVLAGDENFSDEKIIGKDSREVQEQLASIWIHENADLAGMKKAEVETVKSFASRTTDRARPAYGHFLKKQPRHSIEVGTTNSEEYLQSQTGNRRFWPMKLLSLVDLDKLRRDRLQLWGEAAKAESNGESVTLDEALWDDAAKAQEKRRTKDPWEDIIDSIESKTWGTPIIDLVDDQQRIATSDLLDWVLKIPEKDQTRAATMRLAEVMKVLGWERNGGNKMTIFGERQRGYFRLVQSVVTKDDESECDPRA